MRKLAFAFAILASSVAVASAADMAPRPYTKAPAKIAEPIYNWTGLYIGIQGGWSSGEANHTILTDGFGFLNAPFGPTKIKGGNFGGLIGYDYQISPLWVLGVNSEFNGGKLTGLFDNGIAQGFGPGNDDIYQSEVRWFGSTRGKVGLVVPGMPQLMVYGTAGVAYASIFGANGDGLNGVSALDVRQASGTKTQIGYTAGGGVSWMIPGTKFILSAEGAYYDFGTAHINTVTNTGVPHVFDVRTTFGTGRGILTYKF